MRGLTYLNLFDNFFSGPLPSNLTVSGLQKLTTLVLAKNSLNGTLPSWLFSLPSLEYLILYRNKFTGRLDTFQLPKSLVYIDCGYNILDGPIPHFSELVNLRTLYLASNKFSGVLDADIFSHKKLLQFLDLSNNQISGKIPPRVEFSWRDSLEYLNLPHNFLTGGLEQLPWTNLVVLDLRSNLINGSLPWWICKSGHLIILDLSDNNIGGVLPYCPYKLAYSLSVLNLRTNKIHGSIPSTLSTFTKMRSLSLRGNQLEGTVPHSFSCLRYLEVLDLGNNKISDVFPYWLESLPNLQVLVLRSNRFHGSLPKTSNTSTPFASLRIIDISHNKLSGPLPAVYFRSFHAMMSFDAENRELKYIGERDYRYNDSISMVIKGAERELTRILTVLTTIDLSSNNFEGQIPECLGYLHSLLILNLSRNNLVRHIPKVLGNLSMLESLDISNNQLEGKVPQELTNLGFLEVFNLSQNHLSGPIPVGYQLNTFSNDSYAGNHALCGLPLSEECNKGNPQWPQPPFLEDDDPNTISGFSWNEVLMGYCCGITLGFLVGNIMFFIGKPKWFTKIVDRELLRLKERRRIEISGYT